MTLKYANKIMREYPLKESEWSKKCKMQDNTKPCVDIRYLLLAPSGVMLPGYFNFTVYVLHEHLLRQKLATRRLWILFHLADAEWIHRPHVMLLHAVSRKMRPQQTGDCRVIVGTGQRPHCSIIANMQILIIFRGVPVPPTIGWICFFFLHFTQFLA